MKKSQAKPRGRKGYWPHEEPFVTIGFRIPKSLHDQLLSRAQKGFRSMNAELTWLLAKEFGVKPKSPEING